METQLAKIVNAGLAGQPENICLQNIETNTIYEFSQIAGENISDGDLSHPTIQRILNNGHQVNTSLDSNGNILLHF